MPKQVQIWASLVLALVVAVVGAAQAQPVRLTYALPAAIPAGGPVVLDLRIHNDGPADVLVDVAPRFFARISVEVVRPSGERVSLPSVAEREQGFQQTGSTVLKPGADSTRSVVLNRWVDFTEQGVYRILVRAAAGPVRTAAGEPIQVNQPAEIPVRILPRDAEALRLICSGLFQQSLAPSAEEVLRAAMALSYVSDPVAVPYLRRLADRPLLAPEAVEGLVRIGGSEAVAALTELAGHRDEFISSVAKSGLQRLRR